MQFLHKFSEFNLDDQPGCKVIVCNEPVDWKWRWWWSDIVIGCLAVLLTTFSAPQIGAWQICGHWNTVEHSTMGRLPPSQDRQDGGETDDQVIIYVTLTISSISLLRRFEYSDCILLLLFYYHYTHRYEFYWISWVFPGFHSGIRLVPILGIADDDNQDQECRARVSLTSFVSFITSTLDPSYVFSPTNQHGFDFHKILDSTLRVYRGGGSALWEGQVVL